MSRPIPVSRVFACLTVLAACAHAGAAEPDWRGYTSEQQQRSVLAVEQDAEAINKRYYDSAFEEFLPELEQLELSLAQPSSPSTRKACWATGSAARPRPTSTASIAIRTSSAASGVPTAACSWRRPAVRSGSAATCSAKARSATCSSAAPRSTTSPRWPSVAWPTARRLSPTWSRCCARTPVASSCCSRNGAAATRSSSSAAEAQALSSS